MGINNIYSKSCFRFCLQSTESRLSITRPIRFGMQIDDNALSIRKKIEERPEAIEVLNKALEIGFQKSIEVYERYENGSTLVKEYKFGSSKEISSAIESNSRDCRKLLEKQESLQNQGDGIRSAVAILASLIVNEHSLFLIDEPETFLHPPQA